jgi:capsular polysaccharide transport system ATP-binding protein
LVDEVTAVGDAAFKRKSQAVFAERMRESSAVLVNHDMPQLREFCDSGIVLERGKIQYFDNLDEAIAVHEENMSRTK